MEEQIKVVVERDGAVKVSAERVNGPQCISLTEFLERGLGKVVKRQKTRDFYRSARVIQRNQINQKDLSG
jgi:hypothetical protein